MTTTKKTKQQAPLISEYVGAHEAAQLMSINHGRPISAKKVCQLRRSKKHHIRVIKMHHMHLYNREDILVIRINTPHTQSTAPIAG